MEPVENTGGPIPFLKEDPRKGSEEQVAPEPVAPRLIVMGEGANIEFKSWLRWRARRDSNR
jgi:hypothetical protein